VTQEGDEVQVRFTAESAAARQMIAEAAPRLAEMAEARGIRMGQASVDGGQSGAQNGAAGGGDPRHGAASQPRQSPLSAGPSGSSTETEDRIA